MDFVLTYKTARLVKDAASHLDKFLDISYDIESLRRSGFNDTEKCLKKAFKARKRANKKFWAAVSVLNKHYGIRQNPFFTAKAVKKFLHVNNIIYMQFINSAYLYDEYDESIDGPLHTSLNFKQIISINTDILKIFDGYQANFMPTKEMIGMKF